MPDRYNSKDVDWNAFYAGMYGSPNTPPKMVPAVGPGGEPLGPAIQGQGDPFMRPLSLAEIYAGMPIKPPAPPLGSAFMADVARASGDYAARLPAIPNRLTAEPDYNTGIPPRPLPGAGHYLTGEVDPVTGLRITRPAPPRPTQTASNAPVPAPYSARPRFNGPFPLPASARPQMRAPVPATRRAPPIPANLATGGPMSLTDMLFGAVNSPGHKLIGQINAGQRPVLGAILKAFTPSDPRSAPATDYRDPRNWVASSPGMPRPDGLSSAMAQSMGYRDPRSL